MSHAEHGTSRLVPPLQPPAAANTSLSVSPTPAHPQLSTPPLQQASPRNAQTSSPVSPTNSSAAPDQPIDEELEWQECADKWPKLVPPSLAKALTKHNERGVEPVVSRAVLPILDILETQPEELAKMWRMHWRDKEESEAPFRWGNEIHRGSCGLRKYDRYIDYLIVPYVWQFYVAFENENDVYSPKRIRARLERFPDDCYPTVAERNKAEREAGYPEGTD